MLMVHSNIAAIEENDLITDRKFHEGMLLMAAAMPVRIATVNPRRRDNTAIMDAVRVPVSTLPYDVLLLDVDLRRRPSPGSQVALERRIAAAPLVVGQDFRAAEIARRLGVPYVLLVEYDLGTQIVVSTIDQNNPVRRLVRTARVLADYFGRQRVDAKGALAVHCNGYPIYDEIAKWNSNRLLFLDSRMPSTAVVDEETLRARLASLPQRRLRLLFSGRYEAMKGAVDVVSVAVECQKRGLPVELTMYGQGSLRGELGRRAAAAPDPAQIKIHDAVPFPELMKLSRAHDIFVCCHPQSDPSCTYLESFGAGLPIVGYANRMWGRLCKESDAGMASRLGDIASVADSILTLAKDHELLGRLSRNARLFAIEHCAKREFDKRIAGMRQALGLPSARMEMEYSA